MRGGLDNLGQWRLVIGGERAGAWSAELSVHLSAGSRGPKALEAGGAASDQGVLLGRASRRGISHD